MVYAYIAARLTSQWTAVNVAPHACSESDPQLHPSIDMQEVDKLVRALCLHAREVFEKKDKFEARVGGSPYNRALFMLVAQGWYQFNPKLAVRHRQGDEERWTPIYAALNLPLINEFSCPDGWENVSDAIDHYLALAGLPQRTVPIAAGRLIAREENLQRQKETQVADTPTAVVRAARARQLVEQAATGQLPAKWGTRAAKPGEIERLKRGIVKRQKR